MIALPAPFVDTGITLTFNLSFTVRPRWTAGLEVLLPGYSFFYMTVDNNFTSISCFPNPNAFGADLNLRSTASPFGPFLLQTIAPDCADPFNTNRGMASSYPWTATYGPFRLGVGYSTALGVDTETFTWFYDEFTTWAESVGGQSRNGAWTDPNGAVSAGGVPKSTGLIGRMDAVGFRFNLGTNNLVVVEFRDLTVNSYVPDTSGLLTTWLVGLGGGDFNCIGVATGGGFGDYKTVSIAPPTTFRLDANVIDSAGNAIAGAALTPSQAAGGATYPTGTLTAPHAANYEYLYTSWDSLPPLLDRLNLQTAWADAYDPPVVASDRSVPFLQPGPRTALNTRSTFTPATITLAATVPILRSANLWVGAGAVGVAGSVFTVSGGGASVTRTLQESWRDWTGFGVGGKNHAEWGADRYTITKADYLEDATDDVWGWATYSYLRLGITAPSAGTLTVTIAGQHLLVSDNHSTVPATRKSFFSATLTPFTVTYTVTVASGANSVLVDLLFPVEGGPFYYGRVDSVKIEGFAVGVYTLAALQLEAIEDGYLKVDYSTDGRIAGLHTAQDGAWPLGNLPDLPWKEDEQGGFGGSIPWVTLTSHTSGANSDRTIEAFLKELDKIEGYSIAWTQGTLDAAVKDGFGSALVSQGDWVEPLMPHVRLDPSVAYAPPCSVRADRVNISLANGLGSLASPAFLLHARKRLGAVLEAQVVTAGGARSGASVQVDAIRTDTGVMVAGAFTDASGFVSIPVAANGARTFRLEAGS